MKKEKRSFELRMRLASGPTSTILDFNTLINDYDDRVRIAISKNSVAPSNILCFLANDKNWVVRKSVADHPKTPDFILEKLARDSNRFVRLAVAMNKNTHADVLDQIKYDKYSFVRRKIACNPNTYLRTLAYLRDDDDYYVAKCAVKHPKYQNYLQEQREAVYGTKFVQQNEFDALSFF